MVDGYVLLQWKELNANSSLLKYTYQVVLNTSTGIVNMINTTEPKLHLVEKVIESDLCSTYHWSVTTIVSEQRSVTVTSGNDVILLQPGQLANTILPHTALPVSLLLIHTAPTLLGSRTTSVIYCNKSLFISIILSVSIVIINSITHSS